MDVQHLYCCYYDVLGGDPLLILHFGPLQMAAHLQESIRKRER